MNRTSRSIKTVLLIASSGALLTAAGCLPANFWADLGGSAITAVVLQILGALVTGAVGA